MLSTPTTTVTILGGSGTDAWGDPVDGLTEVATGVPCSIMEQRRFPTTPVDGRVQVIRFYTGRVPGGTVITSANRIRDERTNEVYVIDNVSAVHNPVFTPDVRLDLRRAT